MRIFTGPTPCLAVNPSPLRSSAPVSAHLGHPIRTSTIDVRIPHESLSELISDFNVRKSRRYGSDNGAASHRELEALGMHWHCKAVRMQRFMARDSFGFSRSQTYCVKRRQSRPCPASTRFTAWPAVAAGSPESGPSRILSNEIAVQG